MEIIKNIETYDEIKNYRKQYRNFYLYGAGRRATDILKEFLNRNITVDAVVVSNTLNNPKSLLGVKVISIVEITPDDENNCFFIGVAERSTDEIIKILHREKHQNIMCISEKGLEGKWQGRDILKDKYSELIHDYDYARPGYKKEIYTQICQFANLDKEAQVLEVGAGTGQATDFFIDEYHLDLLEVSDAQVNYLKKKYAGRRGFVHKEYFEEYETERKYDLIYSATAFHWVNPEVGYVKTRNLLKDGGTLALFWHMSPHIRRSGRMYEGIYKIKSKYLNGRGLGWEEQEYIEREKEYYSKYIRDAGYSEPQCFVYKWREEYSADRYTCLQNTLLETFDLSAENRTRYLNEIKEYIQENGGKVEVVEVVMLLLVKK